MSLRIQKILKKRADPEDIVIRADHPQRGIRLHHAPAGQEPGAGEIVIGAEACKFVPGVVDGIDAGIVRPLEVALQLQVIRRIGKDEIDASRGKLFQFSHAIADDYAC